MRLGTVTELEVPGVPLNGHAALAGLTYSQAQCAKETALAQLLAAALGVVGTIRQGNEQGLRHAALSRARSGMPPTMAVTFAVIRPFSHLGIEYAVGTLLDGTVVGDAGLYRHELAREVRRVEVGVEVAGSMARPETIARLYAGHKKNPQMNSSVGQVAEGRVCRGFRIERRKLETSYTLDASMLMSTIDEGSPPDQAGRFAELRDCERLQQLMQRLVARRIGFH